MRQYCEKVITFIISILGVGITKKVLLKARKGFWAAPRKSTRTIKTTGLEDLFVAIGGAGTHARNDSMLRHPGELGTPEI